MFPRPGATTLISPNIVTLNWPFSRLLGEYAKNRHDSECEEIQATVVIDDGTGSADKPPGAIKSDDREGRKLCPFRDATSQSHPLAPIRHVRTLGGRANRPLTGAYPPKAWIPRAEHDGELYCTEQSGPLLVARP